MEYKTKGVCSMAIQYDLDDEQKVHNVKFIGGCSGNTQGVAKLVEGMPAKDVIWRESSAAADQLHVQTSLQQL